MLAVPVAPLHAVDAATPRLDGRPLLAAILRVEGDQAVLALAGVQVVARLTSPDQAAWLAGQRTALFVPHWLDGQTLALQWVGSPTAGPQTAPAAVQVAPDLLAQVLRQLGEPTDAPQQQLAAALLANHLPLTAENLDALAAGLAHLSAWGAAQADVAARLLAQGLSLTSGLIDAALAPGPPLPEALAQLRTQIGAFLAQPGAEPAAGLLSQVQAGLDKLVINWAAPPAQLGAQLSAAAAQTGRSLENALAQQSGVLPGPAGAEPSLLLRLAMLRPELMNHFGESAAPLVRALDQFLTAAVREQLGNAHGEPPGSAAAAAPSNTPANASSHTAPSATNPAPAAERWLGLSLPLSSDVADPDWTNAHLRVAYQPPDGQSERINLSHARLVLNLEVDGQPVAVDLSIVGSHVGAHIKLPTPQLRDRAEQELPGLNAGLARLGFMLQAADCTTGEPPQFADGMAPTLVAKYA